MWLYSDKGEYIMLHIPFKHQVLKESTIFIWKNFSVYIVYIGINRTKLIVVMWYSFQWGQKLLFKNNTWLRLKDFNK